MSLYYDGELMDNSKTTTISNSKAVASSGKMVIGREEYGIDDNYVTMDTDELTLWNN